MSGPAPEALANAVWHALTGTQAELGERTGSAVRFPADISPFSAVADAHDARAWADLAELVGPGGQAALFRAAFPTPAGWTVVWQGAGVQMVAPGTVRPARVGPPVSIELLGPADAEEMAVLVERTRPGPWAARTHTLGPFVGARHRGRLVAMAGTRLHLSPHREISAVCTDADHQGRGLAGALVTRVAELIRSDGEIPFLHAAATNTGAIRLYEAMGFAHVREVMFGAFRAPST